MDGLSNIFYFVCQSNKKIAFNFPSSEMRPNVTCRASLRNPSNIAPLNEQTKQIFKEMFESTQKVFDNSQGVSEVEEEGKYKHYT